MAWHMGQAALLAKELQPDKPCPVCGSKEHPNPTSAENDDARSNEDSARNAQQTSK